MSLLTIFLTSVICLFDNEQLNLLLSDIFNVCLTVVSTYLTGCLEKAKFVCGWNLH